MNESVLHGVRLQKVLSQAGVASRRAAEQLIAGGRVTVNGMPVREMGVKADPDLDDIRVDGVRVRAAAKQRYILLYKPSGYVTTRADPQRRPTVIDLLDGVREYVYPVGRLDFDSEGLLLLTNDGDLAALLTHPRHGVERSYEAHVAGVPDEEALRRLRTGIPLDGRRTLAADVVLLTRAGATPPRAGAHPAGARLHGRPQDRRERTGTGPARGSSPAEAGPHRGRERAVLLLTIREGRNRQVRRMCEAIGHPVRRLKRTKIGPLSDRRLKPGEWRDLSPSEVAALKNLAAAAPPDPGPARVPGRTGPRGAARRPRRHQSGSRRS